VTTKIVLGTATPARFPAVRRRARETINETDRSLNVETRNTKGSTENIPLLEAGEARYRAVHRRAGLRGLRRHRPAKVGLKIITRCIRRRHVRGARHSPARTIDDLKGSRGVRHKVRG